MQRADRPTPVLVDLEIGMGRTGIAPGDSAFELYAVLADLPNLEPDGLQGYDGQIRDLDLAERRRSAAPGIAAVHAFRDRLLTAGLPVPRLVLGGTPTFPIHAEDPTPGVECSPGTCVLHDAGYLTKFPDLPFIPAALLLTRVVSQPRAGRICLDLGHKAVAADPVGPRLTLLGLPEATLGGQSEEHLVIEAPTADELTPGTPLLAIPTHICPTCALHSWAYVIDGDGELVDRWEVKARDRVLAI
jgi:D-serine deaminase-like pyridoxal phosphate-dependent protein